MISFVVPGPPYGKARPRHGKYGMYDPASNAEYESAVKAAYLEARGMYDPTTEPIRILVLSYHAIPKSALRKRTEDKIKEGEIFTGKPDADNILKSVMDGLNKTAYIDDSQVWSACCERCYSKNPRVEVFIISKGECVNEHRIQMSVDQ